MGVWMPFCRCGITSKFRGASSHNNLWSVIFSWREGQELVMRRKRFYKRYQRFSGVLPHSSSHSTCPHWTDLQCLMTSGGCCVCVFDVVPGPTPPPPSPTPTMTTASCVREENRHARSLSLNSQSLSLLPLIRGKRVWGWGWGVMSEGQLSAPSRNLIRTEGIKETLCSWVRRW